VNKNETNKLLTLVSAAIIFLIAIVLASRKPSQKPVSELGNSTTTPQLQTTPVVSVATTTTASTTLKLNKYFEVVDSCGPYFDGNGCVNMRSGPGTQYPVIRRLRNGIVLKIASSVVKNGVTWYKIGFDGGVRYPERVESGWYVADGDYLRTFEDPGELVTSAGKNSSSTKRIVVDRKKEMLYAYDGDTLFMEQAVSVGLKLTPTPQGKFWVYKKTPDAYMQGPLPGVSDQYYDLPGVPWDLYFTFQGGAIHGAYWHANFGEPWSHGCVNLPPDQAEILYKWAELGTPVTVID
jgi:lipoprotein-anchoring transpeptidase ErfK/SrfK